MQPENLLTEWAWLLFRSFADAGVRDVVISPGSRSTPLVVAAVREPRLRCHNVIDERAAAFFALGQARVSDRPSLLLCTSGTAAAHYFPAILEARASFVPMLVLTADRPTELQDCAASQTMDQVKLFGQGVRSFFDLGMPDASEGAMRALRRVAAQAMFATTWPVPGAVHLNARMRKPLEPAMARTPGGEALAQRVRAIGAEAITTPAPPGLLPDAAAVRRIAELCHRTHRGLIACGPAPVRHAADREVVFELARVTGFPIACDVTSQLRFAPTPDGVLPCDAFDEFVASASFRMGPLPDLLIQIGAPPVSASWEQLTTHSSSPRVVIAEHGWQDPQSRAAALLFGRPGAIVSAVVDVLRTMVPPRDEPRAWRERIAAANAIVGRVIDEVLATSAHWTEGHVSRVVASALPRGSALMLGNSLAVRVVNQFCAQGACEATVLSQRGIAGIDGLIAGAAGAASQGRVPLTLLLGDVSLLHDLTSLAVARRAHVPLVIVVLQNQGGRIFEQLPLATVPHLEPEIIEHAVTPHDTALEHAGALFGVKWKRVETEEELRAALASAYEVQGCTVIEAHVAAHAAARQNERLRAAVEEALAVGA
jgi:2-succinyl-5-enolpyruvyl-6-hydroxy-3-cyclohexene-1-carboxylate synthase